MLYPAQYGDDPLYPSENDFEVIHKDGNSGHGVITYRSFQPGEIVAKFNGVITDKIQQHTLQIQPGVHILDLDFVGYLLHSCEPNVSLDMKERTITAIKPIEANTFLYMDYAQTEDKLYSQFRCSCGTSKCRGWIIGRKEIDSIFWNVR